jgi:hypothetical protein
MSARTHSFGYACFLFRLKTYNQKDPHTCLYQPHGGYCLRGHNSLATQCAQALAIAIYPVGRPLAPPAAQPRLTPTPLAVLHPQVTHWIRRNACYPRYVLGYSMAGGLAQQQKHRFAGAKDR